MFNTIKTWVSTHLVADFPYEPEANLSWLDRMDSAARCKCGHVKDVHEHYRAGTDCSQCGRAVCPSYRQARR